MDSIGIGLMSFLSQSVGLSPHSKQSLDIFKSKSLAFSFFSASLGMSKYAFFNLALSMHFETSANKISEFSSVESYWGFCGAPSGDILISSSFLVIISL